LRGRSVVAGLTGLLGGRAWGEATARDLQRANLPLRVGELLLVRLLLVLLFFAVPALLLGFQPFGLLAGLGGGVLGYVASSFCLGVLRRRRAAKLENQLVEFLPMLASSLRAGFGLPHGFEAAARQLGPPLAEELALVLSDVNLGAPMHKALEDLGRRVGNPDLDIIITAILVQRTTGGNLAEVLDKAGETLLERERVRGELQTMTAQQRLTGTVLSVYPVAVGLVLLAIMPGMWSRLFTEPVGQIQLAIAVGLQVLGFVAIRRALKVDY
jgi:tight adherence protein B